MKWFEYMIKFKLLYKIQIYIYAPIWSEPNPKHGEKNIQINKMISKIFATKAYFSGSITKVVVWYLSQAHPPFYLEES